MTIEFKYNNVKIFTFKSKGFSQDLELTLRNPVSSQLNYYFKSYIIVIYNTHCIYILYIGYLQLQ